jgi:hypothetical protein
MDNTASTFVIYRRLTGKGWSAACASGTPMGGPWRSVAGYREQRGGPW